MQKITPFLWFDGNAEDAVNFYTVVFPGSAVKNKSYYGEGLPAPAGTLMVASFVLHGQEFIALNGGPQFRFTEAVSFVIDCETQEEVDHYWNKLSADGAEQPCGWLRDKFGLSWQVVPRILTELLADKDAAKAQRVMQAMLQMKKIIIADLLAAEG
ncbi:MAG TPA: VOC family protein [Chitinophagaceae bacterium]|nr:VOC family protein [Chitinophagaceae bacterium]